jgi:Tfp pilus assembly protein PilF
VPAQWNEPAEGELMTTRKKERERVREAMSKSLAAKPSRQAEIAEMLKSRLGAGDRKPAQSNGKKKGKR